MTALSLDLGLRLAIVCEFCELEPGRRMYDRPTLAGALLFGYTEHAYCPVCMNLVKLSMMKSPEWQAKVDRFYAKNSPVPLASESWLPWDWKGI